MDGPEEEQQRTRQTRDLLVAARGAVGAHHFAREVFERFGYTVEDAASIVVLRILEARKLAELSLPEANPRKYCTVTARNLAIDMHRKHREAVPLDEVADVVTRDLRRDPTLPFTTAMERHELRCLINREIEKLAAGDLRKAVSLRQRLLHGATLREAGEAAGVSEGTVRLWVRDALAPEHPVHRLLRELWETYQE